MSATAVADLASEQMAAQQRYRIFARGLAATDSSQWRTKHLKAVASESATDGQSLCEHDDECSGADVAMDRWPVDGSTHAPHCTGINKIKEGEVAISIGRCFVRRTLHC